MQLGEPGVFVDLFAGAGGLALGFIWAGWKPLLANDISPRFLETYAQNVHEDVVSGDIRKPEVADDVVRRTRAAYTRCKSSPRLIVLGGPPCQGFSTAGHARSMHDERNHLFKDYRGLIDRLKPDLFLFENVTGLLNMDRGRVFEMICSILGQGMSDLTAWRLRAEQFAVPQRRTRIFIIGTYEGRSPAAPEPVTAYPKASSEAALAPSVSEAIDDLPPLVAGQDGSQLGYLYGPTNPYQGLMRSHITVAEYLENYPAPTANGSTSSAEVELQLVVQ